jgi:hypothetical protein
MTEDVQRTLGEHAAHITNLRTDMQEIKTDVRAIRDLLSEAKGGWKTLMLIGGVAGVLGAATSKLLHWLMPFLPR